jgi:hypothetical protein
MKSSSILRGSARYFSACGEILLVASEDAASDRLGLVRDF